MWELDYKESWVLKNWCFWTVVLENTLESPVDCKKIKPVNPKGNQAWIFIRRTDAEAETLILWPPDVKNWLIRKDPDAGKDWRQEEKGMTEDEMVGWHHWLDGHELEQAPGVGGGQGGLACCSPWGRKESDTTVWLKWTMLRSIELSLFLLLFYGKLWVCLLLTSFASLVKERKPWGRGSLSREGTSGPQPGVKAGSGLVTVKCQAAGL